MHALPLQEQLLHYLVPSNQQPTLSGSIHPLPKYIRIHSIPNQRQQASRLQQNQQVLESLYDIFRNYLNWHLDFTSFNYFLS